MRNGFDSQRYYTGDRRKTQVWEYSSRRREETGDFLYSSRSGKRRRMEEEEINNISNYGRWSSSDRRRRDEYSSRRHTSLDINYNRWSSNRRRKEEESDYDRSSNKRRRREEESKSRRDDVYHGRSSNKRIRTKEDVSSDINYGRSSNRKREDDNISLSSSKENRHHSCSGPSVIKEDINMISSSSKCDDFSLKSCEDDEDEINTTPVGSFPGFVDDGVVTEILSRLPVISLLRFKSVCKHWRSKITQDQHFIYLHSIRSKSRLLCIAPKTEKKETERRPQHILTADLSVKRSNGEEGKVIIHNVMKTTDENWFDYDDVLEQINGLVCFLDRRAAAVRIYNVSTREVTSWIRSTLLAEEKEKSEREDNPAEIKRDFLPVYQIGFDPEKKEHKVFCFWRLSARPDDFTSDTVTSYSSWEVLTVGRDTKWRRISVVPDENNLIKLNEVLHPHCMDRNPVHANGTIYWRNKLMNCHEGFVMDLAPTDPEVIIAFDIGSEKFRVIPIPSFIHDGTRGRKFDEPIAFLILGGRITLIYQMSNYVVKLWMLDDDGVEKRLENCQGKGCSNWSIETITLPFCFCDRRFVGFHGSAATSAPDKILISQYSGSLSGSFGSYETMSCLYSYDLKTNIFKKMDKMDRILPISLHNGLSLFTTFTESLVRVLPQQEKDRQLELVC
ncbi:hypothetical protein MKX03_016224 [Papaver bracteatum]|nr:hypothetical protein MKX03_016224 [Papaver bracteatum]